MVCGLQSEVQSSHELRCKYWATRSSVCSFARIPQEFACSVLLASLVRSAALIPLFACSLLSSWNNELWDGYFFCVFFSILDHSAHYGPQSEVQNSHESQCKYLAAFGCFALLASLARSAAPICSLTRSLAHSLTPELVIK